LRLSDAQLDKGSAKAQITATLSHSPASNRSRVTEVDSMP